MPHNLPSGTPCPISRTFRPVCSRASTIVFTGKEPSTRATWLLKSTSTRLIPKDSLPPFRCKIYMKTNDTQETEIWANQTWQAHGHGIPSRVCNLFLTAETQPSHFISTMNSVCNQTKRATSEQNHQIHYNAQIVTGKDTDTGIGDTTIQFWKYRIRIWTRTKVS